MPMTRAQIRAQERYRKAKVAQYNLKFHKENDADVISALDRQESKNDFVRRAIRAYLAQGGE